MRYLVIGDIHGYWQPLQDILEMAAPTKEDTIITLGDYTDRGPSSAQVLDHLIDLHRSGKLVALRGNHDVMMVEACRGKTTTTFWLRFGGNETLASYSNALRLEDRLKAVPETHLSFLENDLVDWYEIDSHFFVHANADPNLPLQEQSESILHSEPLWNPQPHFSGKVMVCGHTKQVSGIPLQLSHTICLDTWVYGEGWLTCLDLFSGTYWQANKNGDRREGALKESN